MEMTTIAISKEIKNKISEFGNKGESYSKILLKLYQSARERQLYDLLFDESNTVSVEDALEEAKKKWQK